WTGLLPERAYQRDEDMARKSDGPLADLLRRLIRLQADKVPAGKVAPKIHVVAHSMDNRVLLRALQRIKYDPNLQGPKPIDHCALAAPDIDQEKFDAWSDGLDVVDDVTIYYNPTGWALVTSRTVNLDSRIGARGYFNRANSTLFPRLENVDAQKANTSVLGHDYAMSGNLLLLDLRLLLRLNLRAEGRAATLHSARNDDDYG